MKATFKKHTFYFKRPSGTSRGVLTEKHSWFIEIYDELQPEVKGIGECSVIPGLSPDFIDFDSYEKQLVHVCSDIDTFASNFNLLENFPSILFGLETALLDLKNGGKKLIFQNSFSKSERRIPINGLIWMGDADFMQEQIEQKLAEGFSCLKMKIGAIDLESELKILESIRNRFSSDKITLRVDANGAFSPTEALNKLQQLSDFEIHSIEQPIQQGQWNEMKQLCEKTTVPIALDEELIGINSTTEKINLLETIQPQYIILKPSLHGGITGCKEWISLAEERSIPWWITSALESNIGLNAVCQFTGEYQNNLPQGLGTGGLYTNNIESNLTIENGEIYLKKA
jgi:o-succinylbenzoate synthase